MPSLENVQWTREGWIDYTARHLNGQQLTIYIAAGTLSLYWYHRGGTIRSTLLYTTTVTVLAVAASHAQLNGRATVQHMTEELQSNISTLLDLVQNQDEEHPPDNVMLAQALCTANGRYRQLDSLAGSYGLVTVVGPFLPEIKESLVWETEELLRTASSDEITQHYHNNRYEWVELLQDMQDRLEATPIPPQNDPDRRAIVRRGFFVVTALLAAGLFIATNRPNPIRGIRRLRQWLTPRSFPVRAGQIEAFIPLAKPI